MATKKKATSKKSVPATKKAPAPKKNAPVVKKAPAPVIKNVAVEEKIRTKKSPTEGDTTIFTTLLAIFIVAFVVLGWFVYSRQKQRVPLNNDMPMMMNRTVSNPLNVGPSVVITPELQTVLNNLPSMLLVDADDTLNTVRVVSDVATVQAENWDFFKRAEMGDYVLQFNNRTVLYRPSAQQIINVGVLAAK